MSDWYDQVLPIAASWGLWDTISHHLPDHPKPGDVVFRRRKGRKDRNRYYVLRANSRGSFEAVSAVIQYQKNRNAWAVFVFDPSVSAHRLTSFNGSHQDPVKRYKTLSSAKMALMTNPLDRVGAESDAICEATSDSEKSLSVGNSVPQT